MDIWEAFTDWSIPIESFHNETFENFHVLTFYYALGHVRHNVSNSILADSVNAIRIGPMAGDISIERGYPHINNIELELETIHVKEVWKLFSDESYLLHVLIFRYQLVHWEVFKPEVSF